MHFRGQMLIGTSTLHDQSLYYDFSSRFSNILLISHHWPSYAVLCSPFEHVKYHSN